MHQFIHGKIYFIVDEIDSCETIYSTNEGARPRTYSIHNAQVNAQVNLSVLLKLWWTVLAG